MNDVEVSEVGIKKTDRGKFQSEGKDLKDKLEEGIEKNEVKEEEKGKLNKKEMDWLKIMRNINLEQMDLWKKSINPKEQVKNDIQQENLFRLIKLKKL